MDIQPDKSGSRNRTLIGVGLGCGLLLCLELIAVLVGALFLFPIAGKVSSPFSPSLETPTNEASGTIATPTPPASDSSVLTATNTNRIGSASAPVEIIEYSDFQCPYCQRFWRDTEPQIIANYVKTGKVRFIYRSLGAFLGPESGAAAEAAYCAGDQEKFWQYHDALFTHQGGENSGAFSNDHLVAFATDLKLDIPTFSACLTGGKYKLLVQKDATDGQAAGVQGTPAFLIDGKLVTGAQPYAVIAAAIDAALANK